MLNLPSRMMPIWTKLKVFISITDKLFNIYILYIYLKRLIYFSIEDKANETQIVHPPIQKEVVKNDKRGENAQPTKPYDADQYKNIANANVLKGTQIFHLKLYSFFFLVIFDILNQILKLKGLNIILKITVRMPILKVC